MKRLRSLTFTMLFVVSVFGGFSLEMAKAQTCPQGQYLDTDLTPASCQPNPTGLNSSTDPNAPCPKAGDTRQAFGGEWVCMSPPAPSVDQIYDANGNVIGLTSSNAEAAAGGSKPATPPKDDGKCSLFGSSAIVNCISEGVQWLIKNTLLKLAGFFLWLTTNMFNYAVRVGVLDFKSWAPDALYPIWIIIRQIISLLVVFIGLYLGFMYILGKDEKFARYVPWVIMFALFVNFSYPLTRTAVDISNIISLNIYASAVGPGALEKNSQVNAGTQIVGKLGLTGLVDDATKTANSDMLSSINSVPAALLAVAYVLYAAYIFFMVTALFIMRTAALVFLIVASPLLLVDSVFPMLGERAKLLRKIFFEQLAVGPIFMIMLALTLKFLDVFAQSSALTTSQFGNNISGGDLTISVFYNILMMLIMLWVMLKVTKSTAGSLGEYATNAMGTVGGFATGVAAGGTGLLARKGLGGLAAKARDSKWVTNNQDSFIGRRAYNLSNSVANSTFDIRNTAVAGKMAGIGMGMGMGAKLGYDEEEKKKLEEKRKEALAKNSRIKTRFERDVYKENIFGKKQLDAEGKEIILHKKGDVDAAGENAKRRLVEVAGGGTLFRTKKQIQSIKESLAQQDSEDTSKRIGEVSDAVKKDIQTFNGINEDETLPDGTILTAQQSKARFLSGLKSDLNSLKKTDSGLVGNQAQSLLQSTQALNVDFYKGIEKDVLPDGTVVSKKAGKAKFIADLEKELESLQTTDPGLESNQALSLIKSIKDIRTAEVAEKIAFDKQIQNVLNTYKRKVSNPRDQARYLSDQTEEVFNEINALLAAEGAGNTALVRQERIQKVAEGRAENSASNIPGAREKQEASRTKAEVFSGNRTERGGAAVDIDITQPATPVDIDITQPSVVDIDVTQPSAVDIDISQPYNVEKVATQSFAEKAAATRAAKQAKAAQAANTQMNQNAAKSTPQAPVTSTTPSNPPVIPPVTV